MDLNESKIWERKVKRLKHLDLNIDYRIDKPLSENGRKEIRGWSLWREFDNWTTLPVRSHSFSMTLTRRGAVAETSLPRFQDRSEEITFAKLQAKRLFH